MLFTQAYVRIDPSIDSTKIIVSILGHGTLRQRESLMKPRIRGGINIPISMTGGSIILLAL